MLFENGIRNSYTGIKIGTSYDKVEYFMEEMYLLLLVKCIIKIGTAKMVIVKRLTVLVSVRSF